MEEDFQVGGLIRRNEILHEEGKSRELEKRHPVKQYLARGKEILRRKTKYFTRGDNLSDEMELYVGSLIFYWIASNGD